MTENPPSQQTQPPPQVSTALEIFLRGWLIMVSLAMLADAGIQHHFSGMENAGWTPWLVRAGLIALLLVTHLVLLITPKLPRRAALLLTFGGYWVVSGGFPLPILDIDQASNLIQGIEAGIAAGVLGLVLIPGGSPRSFVLARRPWSSGWHTIAMILLSCLFMPILVVATAIDGLAWGVAQYSHGYMRIRPHGLVLQERRYARGADEVWLVGMMHIAQADFYKGLFPPRGDVPPTIVLLEGVTDREGKLRGGFHMDNMAKLLGLSSQGEAAIHLHPGADVDDEGETNALREDQIIRWNNGMSLRRADVDIGEFRPETLTYLGEIGEVFQSSSLPIMLKRLFDPKSPLANQRFQKLAFEDILDKRNAHLMTQIEASFPAYDRVIVPWGALHLPEVGDWLKENGFEEKERVERVAVSFLPNKK